MTENSNLDGTGDNNAKFNLLSAELVEVDTRPEYDPSWPESQRVAIAKAILLEWHDLNNKSDDSVPAEPVPGQHDLMFNKQFKLDNLRMLSDYAIIQHPGFLDNNRASYDGWFKPPKDISGAM